MRSFSRRVTHIEHALRARTAAPYEVKTDDGLVTARISITPGTGATLTIVHYASLQLDAVEALARIRARLPPLTRVFMFPHVLTHDEWQEQYGKHNVHPEKEIVP